MILPGTAAIPAVHADRLRAAEATGRAAMALAAKKLTPDKIVTAKSVENALRVLMAIGGSTNAVLHLTAVAGRAGIDIALDRLNEISDSTPVLVDLKPTGPHYMEDLFAAGGVGAVLRELQPLLHLDCLTVAGERRRLAPDHGDALLQREGLCLRRIVGDADDQMVDQLHRPLDDVEMAKRHRIEGARI